MRRVPKSDWYMIDVEDNVLVRQLTNRLRSNKWQLKRGQDTIVITDKEFEQYRRGELKL